MPLQSSLLDISKPDGGFWGSCSFMNILYQPFISWFELNKIIIIYKNAHSVMRFHELMGVHEIDEWDELFGFPKFFQVDVHNYRIKPTKVFTCREPLGGVKDQDGVGVGGGAHHPCLQHHLVGPLPLPPVQVKQILIHNFSLLHLFLECFLACC